MKPKKMALGVVVALAVMVGAVAAQQPTPATPPSAAAVLDALKRPTAPPDAPAADKTDDASVAAVLARYNKIIAAGAAIPPPSPQPIHTAGAPRRATPATEPGTAAPTSDPTPADSLDAIRADLAAILTRLDALARKDRP